MSNSLSTLINKVQILIYLVHYRCLNYSAVWYFSALWYQIFGLLVFILLAFLPCLIETLHKNICIELAQLRNVIIEKSNLNHEFIEFVENFELYWKYCTNLTMAHTKLKFLNFECPYGCWLYSEDLNTRLVQYFIGPNCPLVKWCLIWIASKISAFLLLHLRLTLC